MNMIFALVCSYLIGSIPTAYIYGKLYKGIDIRDHGSGNVGATNVFRVLGKVPGIIVLVLDIFKGVVAVALIPDLFHLIDIQYRVFMALAVVIGHNWTIFLNFKGGKGIATSLGVLIGLTIKLAAIRPVLLISLSLWVISFLTFRFVSLASIIAATSLPIIMLFTGQEFPIVCFGAIICVFVVVRHRPNIKRLFMGQEPRVNLFSSDKKPPK